MLGLRLLACLTVLALTAAPVVARQPDKPVTDDSVSAKDVAMTPATDLNLSKDKIPALLLAAQERPYATAGIDQCPALARAIAELDIVLGPDVDAPGDERDGITAGRVAKAAVSSFIPFRGLIREVSGANQQQRRMQDAIEAGIARRAYLKGYAQAKGCNAKPRAAPSSSQQPTFVSRPVVQKTE